MTEFCSCFKRNIEKSSLSCEEMHSCQCIMEWIYFSGTSTNNRRTERRPGSTSIVFLQRFLWAYTLRVQKISLVRSFSYFSSTTVHGGILPFSGPTGFIGCRRDLKDITASGKQMGTTIKIGDTPDWLKKGSFFSALFGNPFALNCTKWIRSNLLQENYLRQKI